MMRALYLQRFLHSLCVWPYLRIHNAATVATAADAAAAADGKNVTPNNRIEFSRREKEVTGTGTAKGKGKRTILSLVWFC